MSPNEPADWPVAEIYRQIEAINGQVRELAGQERSDAQVAAVRALLLQVQPLRQELRQREAVRVQALADFSIQELKLLMEALLDDRLRVLGDLAPGQAPQGELFDRFWRIEHEINALTRAMQGRLRPQ